MNPTNVHAQEDLQSNVPYDVIELPSKGMFSKNKKSSIKVSYLTAADENIIMSQNLVQSGEMVDVLLRRKILEPDFQMDELLECDKEAILLFLRNTAYGAKYEITLVDSKDNTNFTHTVDLSTVGTKEFKLKPDSDNNFDFTLPSSKKKIKFRFLTGKEENELQEEIYYLVKHANFSYQDCLIMPVYERRFFIDKMVQEVQQKQENIEKARNKRNL